MLEIWNKAPLERVSFRSVKVMLVYHPILSWLRDFQLLEACIFMLINMTVNISCLCLESGNNSFFLTGMVAKY